MEFGWSALWFIVAVSLLVTVHEFGHFWVARKLGFKVLRFSVGFGKPLLKRVGGAPDHTEYVIAAVPLGGYVRMLDERDGAVPTADLPRAFTRRPPWQRILVLLAGPAANILFAVIVLWAMFWVNGIVHVRALVDKVTTHSPAATAGLRVGDEIREIDGARILDQGDASFALLDAMSDDGVAVIGVRGKDRQEREVTLNIPDLEQRHRSGSVVVGAVQDLRAVDAVVVEVSGDEHPFILQRRVAAFDEPEHVAIGNDVPVDGGAQGHDGRQGHGCDAAHGIGLLGQLRHRAI